MRCYNSNNMFKVCITGSTVCDEYECVNDGQCVTTFGTFGVQLPKCECPIPFSGPRCEDGTVQI